MKDKSTAAINTINTSSQVLRTGRMRCIPTRYGWTFMVVIFGMLVGSVNYNNNLGFLFTFLLGSMAVVSVLHSYRNFSGIRIESVQTWPVFEKQPAVFQIHLRETTSHRVAIRFSFPGQGTSMVDLAPGMKNRVTVSMTAQKRGLIAPQELVLDSIYPFGLLQHKAVFKVDIGCVVYPKPIPVHQLTTLELLQAHEMDGNAPSSADDFNGLRSYQSGDPIQHIFWKAYSKGQGLMIKEFTGAETPSLFFSWHKIKAETVEKKLSILCAMILKAHGLKIKYGLKLPGKAIFPDGNERHKHKCLQALALF